MKDARRLWVVEEKVLKAWRATLAATYTQAAGRALLKRWQAARPADKYRLRQYVPAEGMMRAPRALREG